MTKSYGHYFKCPIKSYVSVILPMVNPILRLGYDFYHCMYITANLSKHLYLVDSSETSPQVLHDFQ